MEEESEAHGDIDPRVPDKNGDDLNRHYVRMSIESGIADADAGRIVDVSVVRAEFGLRK